jgi:hypothetical protein
MGSQFRMRKDRESANAPALRAEELSVLFVVNSIKGSERANSKHSESPANENREICGCAED